MDLDFLEKIQLFGKFTICYTNVSMNNFIIIFYLTFSQIALDFKKNLKV